MAYTPPTGLVSASLTGEYTPPVGVVTAVLCALQHSNAFASVASLSGGCVLSVSRPGTLAASTSQVSGAAYVPVLIRAFGEIIGSFHVSVATLPDLLSSVAALEAGYQISVEVGGQLLTAADLSGGWCQETLVTAPAFTAAGELLGDVQISCFVVGTLNGVTVLSARFAEGRIISNAVLEQLAVLDGGFFVSVNLNGLVLDSGTILSGTPVIAVRVSSAPFTAVGSIMGTRLVVAPTILSGQHPSVESATTAFSLLTLHDGSTRTWH